MDAEKAQSSRQEIAEQRGSVKNLRRKWEALPKSEDSSGSGRAGKSIKAEREDQLEEINNKGLNYATQQTCYSIIYYTGCFYSPLLFDAA